jgi:hypothetical protein
MRRRPFVMDQRLLSAAPSRTAAVAKTKESWMKCKACIGVMMMTNLLAGCAVDVAEAETPAVESDQLAESSQKAAGDAKDWLLWRAANGGPLAMWLMNNGSIVGETYIPGNETSWQVKGAGDFNEDGHGDILWRHTSGQVAIHYMQRGLKIGEAYPGGQDPGLSWTIQGVGDFDGNGSSDILWRYQNGAMAIWLDGDNRHDVYPYGSGPGNLEWQVEGIGDLNGNGHDDILWRHTTGQVAIHYMRNAAKVGESYPGRLDPERINTIEGIGDFDGDGGSDILWRDRYGQVSIWFRGDATRPGFVSYQNSGLPVALNWQAAAVGDLNGNGRADIVWFGPSGEVAIWMMAGARHVGEAYPRNLDRSWSIQGLFDGE